MWDCSGPRSGNGAFCSNGGPSASDGYDDAEQEERDYSPRTGGFFYRHNSGVRGQPPVAVVIPPVNVDTTSHYTPSKPRKAAMVTDITVETIENVSSHLSNDEAFVCGCKRELLIMCITVFVLVAGIFSIGIGVGVGVRGKEMPADSSSQAGNGSNNNPSQNSTDLTVGAYYYPWYGANFHNGDGYLRSQLDPPQFPTLGEYDDTQPETISKHLKWSRQANIGLWITSWWGPDRLEDSTTKDVILKHEDLGNMKIALHYETTGRVRDGDVENVKSDTSYMCETYFNHDNYYKIDGRPVIFVYVTRQLESEGLLEQVILTMRTTANRCGQSIFIVGDQVFQQPPQLADGEVYKPFLYFDAVTNYDMYGSLGSTSYYAGTTGVAEYYSEQKTWKDMAAVEGCRYVPTVSPGFNDRGVRLDVDHMPLSRRLTPDSPEGSLFAMSIEEARRLVDPLVSNLLVVNSFNEWHEDTQIEPVVGPMTDSPVTLTEGVQYSGYGELYLNILWDGTQPEGQSPTNTSAATTRSAGLRGGTP